MSKNVLIADDDKAIRTLLVKGLEAIGVENTTEAADGDEALALSQQNKFDLILLDWDMPGKTGLEVLQAIRAEDPQIPVVMVTGEKKRERVLEAANAGATDYVIKPFDLEMLKKKLAAHWNNSGSQVNATVFRCGQVMRSDVITINADATIGDAIALLLQHGISGLPVVDDQDQIVGIVTEFSLIPSITRPELKAEPISSVMTTDVITVTEDAIPVEVVRIMQTRRIRRVPVVRNGEVVGVIARRDILRYVTENEKGLRELFDEVKSAAQQKMDRTLTKILEVYE
ncbi:MAG: response regulator [Planctomycetes bacterium]|nr:response regulator [Planctomycetota bacterium]